MSDAPRPVKLLLDENLSPWVARQLRSAGVDAVHVNERAMTGTTDAQVLERAYVEDRILVTSNVGDFEQLCGAREVHAGVVLIRDGHLVRADQLAILRRLVTLLEREPDMVNRALEIDVRGRHWFRNLP